MPVLDNPKHEMVARAFIQTPIAKKAYKIVYPNSSDPAAETDGPKLLRNPQVKGRIHELLEGNGLTDSYLIRYGKERFLEGKDLNIAQKAWKTYLEIAGIINTEQSSSIASVVFNELTVNTQVTCEQPVDKHK